MSRILIVVDMQNDFIDGILGTKEAQAIIPNVVAKISSYENDYVIYTMDTHDNNYLSTQEGKNLPVTHCVSPSHGWTLNNKISQAINQIDTCERDVKAIYEVQKGTFGSLELSDTVSTIAKLGNIDSIELVGVCTGICVISNAIILKNQFPEVPIMVDASCCACVTPESHNTALLAMQMCQIKINHQNNA